jgi:hypothetical protein
MIALANTPVNEVQSIITTGTPAGGTFTLQIYGDVTTPLGNTATAPQIQAALIALANVGNNVSCTGGPLPTPVVVTFNNYFAGQAQQLITLATNSLTGGTTPTVVITRTTPGSGQYDPVSPWFDLGATKTGVKITRNSAEDVFDVDQIYGDLDARPNNWQMTIATALSEVSLVKLQVAWELGTVTVDSTPTTGVEAHLGIGLPINYTKRRLAILYQRPNGFIRAVVFRKVVKTTQDSDLTYMKTGDQITVPLTFRALIDTTVGDITQNLGEIVDQANE